MQGCKGVLYQVAYCSAVKSTGSKRKSKKAQGIDYCRLTPLISILQQQPTLALHTIEEGAWGEGKGQREKTETSPGQTASHI